MPGGRREDREANIEEKLKGNKGRENQNIRYNKTQHKEQEPRAMTGDVSCDGRVFGAFPGCITRCFTLTSRFRSTPCNVAIFSLSFFFFGCANNRGICEATKDSSILQKRGKEGASGGAFARPSNADPELRHNK